MIIESYVGFGIPDAKVVHEESLQGAINQLRRKDYDVVLLDLGLPDAQGLETVTGINQAGFDVPVVVLTAAGEHGLGMLCLQAGAQDFLNKTELNPEVLKKAIEYAAARRGEVTVLELTQELTALREICQAPKSPLAGKLAADYEQCLSDHGLSDQGNAKRVAQKVLELNGSPDDLLLAHIEALAALCKAAPDRRRKYLLNRGRLFLLAAMTDLARLLGEN